MASSGRDARATLSKCVESLMEVVNDLGNSSSSKPANRSSALEEHRKLFNFKPSSADEGRRKGGGKWQKWTAQKATKPYTGKWTHKFVCLSKKNENQVPSARELFQLSQAGLGFKEITMNKVGGFSHFCENLFKAFPKLKNGGGFEILRTASKCSNKTLEVIPSPPGGYNVGYLKACLNQAKAYICPIQQDLSLDPIIFLTDEEKEPTEMCMKCGADILITQLKTHVERCAGENGCDLTEEDDEELLKSIWDSEATKSGSNEEQHPHTSTSNSETYSVQPDIIDDAVPGCSGIGLDNDPFPCTGTNTDSSVLFLMFPNHDKKYLDEVFHKHNLVDDAVAEILDSRQTQDQCGTSDLQSISEVDPLIHYRRQIVHQGKQFIAFNRMQISTLRQLMCLFKDPKLDMRKEPDVNFVGELGVDMGGPKREFFSIAIQSLSKVDVAYNLQLFGGEPGHLIPLYGVDAISEGCFIMAGKLIAYSILHSCEGLVGLSPAVIEYIATGSVTKAADKVTTADIHDIELRNIIETKIMEKDSLDELTDEERDKVEEKMVGHGLTDIPLTKLNKDKSINDLIIAEVIITRVVAMDAFFSGLDCLGLGKLLRSYPNIIAPLVFPSIEDFEVCPEDIHGKFEKGCQKNNTEEEKQVSEWFFKFIHDSALLKDDNTGRPLISSLVKFVTGSQHVQYSDNWEVSFNTEPSMLLQADSCFNKIILPISHNSYDDFKKACITSLTFGGVGYGKF